MSVSLTNQDYCLCDQQDRSDGSVVGSEGKLKSTLSKSASNETYETNVEEEEHDDEVHLNSSERIQNSNFAAQLESQKSNLSSHHSIPHHGCSSSSSSSSSSLLPSRASSGRHSTPESIIAEAPAPSIVLPRLQLPLPPLSSPSKSKPVPKKSASFSCMKAAESSSNGFYLNPSHHHPHHVHSHNHPHPHSSISSHPLHHHPSTRVPSRELKKGCSRITRSKSNLSLAKKHPLRHEFEFPRFNLFPHSHPHHHRHHDGQLLLPPGTFIGHQHHNHAGRKGDNSSINQYPLCVTCLQSNREGSTSFKLRKDFILEMQEERMRIQELMNRRKIRKQQKSNEKLALIAILLINVAFFISFCFLGMMFLRSVRLPTSS